MSSVEGGHGIQIDVNVVMKRLGRLKRFLTNNDVTRLKALSTTILADVTAIDASIQAIVTNANELSDTNVLPIHDTEYQTSDS